MEQWEVRQRLLYSAERASKGIRERYLRHWPFHPDKNYSTIGDYPFRVNRNFFDEPVPKYKLAYHIVNNRTRVQISLRSVLPFVEEVLIEQLNEEGED